MKKTVKKSEDNKVISFAGNNFYKARAEEVLAKAIHYFAGQYYEKALNEFEVSKRLDPGNAEIFFYSAICKSILEQEDAIEDHKKSVELDPENESYKLWYGISLYTNEEYERSLQILESLYNEGYKEERVRNYLFRSMIHLEKYSRVISCLSKVEFPNEFTVDEINSLGIAYHGIGEYSKSIEVLQHIENVKEYRAKTVHYICDSYTKLGLYDKALNYLDNLKDVPGKKFIKSYKKSIEFLKEMNET